MVSKTALEEIAEKEPVKTNVNLSKVIEKELSAIEPKIEQPIQAKPAFSFENMQRMLNRLFQGYGKRVFW